MKTLPYTHPGTPGPRVLRGPGHLLLWVARRQWPTIGGAVVLGTVWMLSTALVPAAIGRTIDYGILPGDTGQLLRWSGAVLALAVVGSLSGVLRHRLAVSNWLQSAFRGIQLVGHHAADTGPALPRAVPTGEIVANVATDSVRVGALYDVVGRFAGGIISYAVVAAILLSRSVTLGLVVLLGVPVLVASLSGVLRPLQRRQATQREESGRLTTLGSDTVAGLRVLRGIGGEQTFLRRYVDQSQRVRRVGVRVAPVQSTLDAAQVLLPGIFVVLVTWIGARLALEGQLRPGDLVAFYGYAAFLVVPLRTATEFADKAIRAWIAAGRTIAILSTERDTGGVGEDEATPEPDPGDELHDPVTGARIGAGLLTAVVSARPEESVALADRLGRFGTRSTPVTWGPVPLAAMPLQRVRDRIVVSENDARMFTGSLRAELETGGRRTEAEILRALHVASAEDILHALPAGLDSDVEERGRSFSGGQRQRLTLVRALLTDAEVLVLVEPTSAVDAHTEARIAARLAEARRARTTVVLSASPLVLDAADRVLFLQHGRVTDAGTHHHLLATSAAYRSTVIRGEDS